MKGFSVIFKRYVSFLSIYIFIFSTLLMGCGGGVKKAAEVIPAAPGEVGVQTEQKAAEGAPAEQPIPEGEAGEPSEEILSSSALVGTTTHENLKFNSQIAANEEKGLVYVVGEGSVTIDVYRSDFDEGKDQPIESVQLFRDEIFGASLAASVVAMSLVSIAFADGLLHVLVNYQTPESQEKDSYLAYIAVMNPLTWGLVASSVISAQMILGRALAQGESFRGVSAFNFHKDRAGNSNYGVTANFMLRGAEGGLKYSTQLAYFSVAEFQIAALLTLLWAIQIHDSESGFLKVLSLVISFVGIFLATEYVGPNNAFILSFILYSLAGVLVWSNPLTALALFGSLHGNKIQNIWPVSILLIGSLVYLLTCIQVFPVNENNRSNFWFSPEFFANLGAFVNIFTATIFATLLAFNKRSGVYERHVPVTGLNNFTGFFQAVFLSPFIFSTMGNKEKVEDVEQTIVNLARLKVSSQKEEDEDGPE